MKRILKTLFFFTLLSTGAHLAWAQDEDLRLHAVWIKGNVMAYHNENDETARLYQSQTVDDGDKVITAAESEAVLKLKGRATIYLGPRTKINLNRLRLGDKGPQCRINLVTGRMLVQLDQVPEWPFEITAESVLCRAHGTLFEIIRVGEELHIVSYEGAIVANFHGQTKIAKANEVLKLDHGKFRSKNHHLNNEEQGHLTAWQELSTEISKK